MSARAFAAVFSVLLLCGALVSSQEDDPKDKKEPLPDGLKALRDSDPNVRYRAALILSRLGPTAKFAIPELREALKDKSPLVRVKVAEAIWQVERPLPSVILPTLTAALTEKDAETRSAAADVLGLMGSKAAPATAALIKALADKDEGVQTAVIEALGEIGPPARKAAPALLALLRDGELLLTEPSIVVALSKLGPGIVPDLSTALDDKSARKRQGAAFALGLMGPAAVEAAPALTERLDDKNTLVRVEAARALGKIGKEANKAAPKLAVLLDAKEVRLRLAGAEALWWIEGRATTIGILAAPLSGKDLEAALDACTALGRIGAPAQEALPALLKTLERHDEAALVRQATETLGLLGPAAKTGAPLVKKLFQDKDASQRAAAGLAFWRITGSAEDTLALLKKGLKEKNSGDRMLAAQCLGEMAMAARPALTNLVDLWDEEENASVRQAIRLAAHKIDAKAAARAGIR